MFVCVLVCTDQLGVENGDIPDANFKASDVDHPTYMRLNNNQGVWYVDHTISYPWLQVDIGNATSVSGLLTQGSAAYSCWITQLKVSTFTAADDPEVFIKAQNGSDKVIFILCSVHTNIFVYSYFHGFKYRCQFRKVFKFAVVSIYS